jgi:hypothetical protein
VLQHPKRSNQESQQDAASQIQGDDCSTLHPTGTVSASVKGRDAAGTWKSLRNLFRVRMTDPISNALVTVREADHVLGAEEPELTLIEYGDFGCPFCFAADRPVRSSAPPS